MVDAYSFGSIVINGKRYTSDIIIYPDGHIRDPWWRKSGHRLLVEDVTDLIESGPEIIIAGTGAYGCMEPDKGLISLLSKRSIEFRYAPTGEAIRVYNEASLTKRAGACLHLTC